MVPMASLHNGSLREQTSDHVASQTSGDISNADSPTFIAADREDSRDSSPPKNVENATFGTSNSSFAEALPILTGESLARHVNPNAAEKEVASVEPENGHDSSHIEQRLIISSGSVPISEKLDPGEKSVDRESGSPPLQNVESADMEKSDPSLPAASSVTSNEQVKSAKNFDPAEKAAAAGLMCLFLSPEAEPQPSQEQNMIESSDLCNESSTLPSSNGNVTKEESNGQVDPKGTTEDPPRGEVPIAPELGEDRIYVEAKDIDEDKDVVCGQGNSHPGMKRWCDMVELVSRATDESTKSMMKAMEINESIRRAGGRFIQRMGATKFYVMPKDEAFALTLEAFGRELVEFDKDKHIVMGRGGKSIHNPANKAWRSAIEAHADEYHQEPKIKYGDKTKISESIVESFEAKGARFVTDENSVKNRFYLVPKIEAVKKTSQCLREKRKKKRDASNGKRAQTTEDTKPSKKKKQR